MNTNRPLKRECLPFDEAREKDDKYRHGSPANPPTSSVVQQTCQCLDSPLYVIFLII
jgi:hypothetical protein